MVPLKRCMGVLTFEMFAVITAILGFGAASRSTLRTLDVVRRPLEWRTEHLVESRPESKHVLAEMCPSETGFQPTERAPTDVLTIVPKLTPWRLNAVLPVPYFRNSPLPHEDRRVRIGVEDGRTVVAKVYGDQDSRVVLLPDGSLGWPNEMVYTKESFRPQTGDELSKKLLEGPYRHFGLVRTDHYLVFHTGSADFARQSGQLLESLYRGLMKRFGDLGIPVHEADFPLVAVIFRNETEFREHQVVANDIQAYYEVVSNRIFFFQDRDRDPEAPEIAAMRQPQTVLHEGTHQILINIGVQPRLAPWPTWLTEGLAEFAAPTTLKTGEWEGFGKTNPVHLATLNELDDTLALQGRSSRLTRNRVGRALGNRTVADLLEKTDFSPTDYAVSWGLTNFLVSRKPVEFAAYLKEMSEMPPFSPAKPGDESIRFRRHFGDDLSSTGQGLLKHLCSLKQKRSDSLPYYTVTFEQPIGEGLVRRGTMVSQSPLMIRQWLETMSAGSDDPFRWWAYSYSSRTTAFAEAEQWIRSR